MFAQRSLILVLILSFAALVSRAVATETVHGKVEAAGNGMIAVTDQLGTRHTFGVDGATKVTLDGRKIKLEEIPQGAVASVMSEMKNDSPLAVMITAESPL